MGTASTKKFIRNNAGTLTEESALLTSAGPADADRVPALGADGYLDPSLLNAKATSTGASDANKVPLLDGSGRLHQSLMPVGVAADVKVLPLSESVSAGNVVNIWNDGGVAKVRKADATTAGKEVHGFVLAAGLAGSQATVYFEGANTACSGLTPGQQFLSTTAGLTSPTAPSGSGNVVQRVGFAVSATEFSLQVNAPIVLA